LLECAEARVEKKHATGYARLLVLPFGQFPEKTSAVGGPVQQAKGVTVFYVGRLLQEAHREVATVACQVQARVVHAERTGISWWPLSVESGRFHFSVGAMSPVRRYKSISTDRA
jgi:hypothetical protein